MKEVVTREASKTPPGTPANGVGVPTHFYYLATTMLLIELAIALWITGLIRPLGTGWPF